MSSMDFSDTRGRSEDARACDLFERQLRASHVRADRLFLALLLI